MSATVQAACPKCRKILRIPLNWSDRAMKCKHCGTIVQLRKRETMEPAQAAPISRPTRSSHPLSVPPPGIQPSGVQGPPAATQNHRNPVPTASPPSGVPPQAFPPPGVQPPSPVEPASEFALPDDLVTIRSSVQRRADGKLSLGQKLLALLFGLVILSGSVMLGMKFQNRLAQNQASATASSPPVPTPERTQSASTAALTDPYPRRMLFIHLSRYVYFNNLATGQARAGGDLPTETARKIAFDFRIPVEAVNNQLFVLSDTADNMPPVIKPVLAEALKAFFATCRPQDRVLIFFSGHVHEQDGAVYLVPVEGDPEDVATLVPLAEVYQQLGACAAQQKIMLFDVCRFNPGTGSARAGGEPMSESLAAALHAVPAGVEVITSCSAGQHAQETTDRGSEFLAAFRIKSRDLNPTGALTQGRPDQPIPIERWAEVLREYLASKRVAAPPQTLKATLPPRPETPLVAYNREEAPAARFAWQAVPPTASKAEVEAFLRLVDLPGIRRDLELPPLASVYPFAAEVMAKYAPDVPDEACTDRAKYPVRAAALAALRSIRENWTFGTGKGLRETLSGAADDALKKQIAADQAPIAKLELELSERLRDLEAAGKQLGEEPSPRWQAVYLYALAQTQLRWAFVNEYNLALGNIRTDNLEAPPGGGRPVYRLVSVEKMQSKRDIQERVADARELFERLAREHRGTPLEVLAKMHRRVALGLTWKLEAELPPEPSAADGS